MRCFGKIIVWGCIVIDVARARFSFMLSSI